MKFRPQIQLRFRDVEQHGKVKALAEKEGLSVNEWIIRRIENGKVREVRSSVEAPQIPQGDLQEMRGKPKGDATSSGEPKREKKAGKGEGAHDPKICRVYRCGKCAGLGFKDENRGLR